MFSEEFRQAGKDHLKLQVAKLPSIALLPGDPARVLDIAAQWDSYTEVGNNREFFTVVGSYRGLALTACSTGIGCASTEIAMIELYQHGVTNFIRVGTSGGLAPMLNPGDLVVLSGAVRYSGAADAYVPAQYPALAHYEMVMAFIEASETQNCPCHIGLGLSLDSFYATKTELVRETPFPSEIKPNLSRWIAAGILQIDMEAATVFVLASLLGGKAGAICTVGSNLSKGILPDGPISNVPAINLACNTALLLDHWNGMAKKSHGFFYPSLLFANKEI